jgi:hypothetical protein
LAKNLTVESSAIFVIEESNITQRVKPSQFMKETEATNPWKKL